MNPTNEFFSRSHGLLETEVLMGKTVTCIGLGSFGGSICLELTKAGVGRLHIFDMDTISEANIVRHACAAYRDIGRLKTDVVAEACEGKNPYMQVVKHPVDIMEQPDELEAAVKESQLVMICTDSNPSRFLISRMLEQHGVVGIYGRATSRAESVDCFVQRPGKATYEQLICRPGMKVEEEVSSVASGQRSGEIPAYADDPNALVQVGLSVDILPAVIMMVKQGLIALSTDCPEGGLKQPEADMGELNYFVWANFRYKRCIQYAPFSTAGAMPTTFRWYGAHIERSQTVDSPAEYEGAALGDLSTLPAL